MTIWWRVSRNFWEELEISKPELSGKPFDISKWEVGEAYKKVKGNQGAPGIDGQTLGAFEEYLQGSLNKIWNRMPSGPIFLWRCWQWPFQNPAAAQE